MLIREQHVNETENLGCGESGLYEPYTDDIGKLFRDYQKEFGRCTSKVYIDEEGKSRAIGWVFQKKQKYSDTGEEYEHAVWVTLYEKEPTVVTTHHYNYL